VQMLLAPDDLIRATGARTGLLARVGIF
jgi:hypothetical protein